MKRQYKTDDSMTVLNLAGSVVAEIDGLRIPDRMPAELLGLPKETAGQARLIDEAADEVLESFSGLNHFPRRVFRSLTLFLVTIHHVRVEWKDLA